MKLAASRTLVLGGALAAALTTSALAEVVWPNVLVQLHGSGRAYIVDLGTDKVVADLATGKGGGLGSLTPNGRKLYVSNAAPGETEVVVIDLDKKAVATRIKTGNRPKHALVSPDGKWVGVNHWGLDGQKLRVSFIDAVTDKVVKEIGLDVKLPEVPPGKSLADYIKGVTSMHNAWSNDSRYFYTSDRVDDEFVVIDTRDWSVKSIAVGSKPHYMAPSPDGKEVWLTVEGKDAANPPMAIVYAVGDLKELARVKMPLEGQNAVEGHHGTFTQDGKHFMLLNRGPGNNMWGNEIIVVNAASKQVVKRLETRSRGIGHAYNSPDGRLAVITNYGNNVVTIIDTTKWTTVKDLVLGWGRIGHVAFTKNGRFAYVSNDQDGVLYKIDMAKLEAAGEIKTSGRPGGAQVLNVWTNVFEELPR
jgi:DNA-binding beta-propeller fold protein YncE